MSDFDVIKTLSALIDIPSLSKEENNAASFIRNKLSSLGFNFEQHLNNTWVKSANFDESKFTILLNSHIDTVKPNKGYTIDPYQSQIKEGKLFGLGSNDAGGPLIALMGTFVKLQDRSDLPFNLVFAATAEEEISGQNGIAAIWDKLPKIDLAIVGEPTMMEMAVAERGLMVLDCCAKGISGHAARKEGVNAIYKAIEDINWFNSFDFPNHSNNLGGVSMNVTVINAGSQHNVVPAECNFVVDVRVPDTYSNEEVLAEIQKHVSCDVKARSTRLNSSGIPLNHPLFKVADELNINTYGSPTLSDQALMNCDSIKMGPGDSARSHTADEFIYVDELEIAVDKYVAVLDALGKRL